MSNYEAGRRLEYEVRDRFRELGYHVLRTAGSHGFYDLVAIKEEQILLIQCKLVSKASEAARLRSQWLSNPPFKPFNFPAIQVLATKVKGSKPFYLNT